MDEYKLTVEKDEEGRFNYEFLYNGRLIDHMQLPSQLKNVIDSLGDLGSGPYLLDWHDDDQKINKLEIVISGDKLEKSPHDIRI